MSDGYLGFPAAGYQPMSNGASIDLEALRKSIVKELGELKDDGERFLKVYREDSISPDAPAGSFLEHFDFGELREVENRVASKHGGGHYRLEIWAGGKKVGSPHTFTLPGAPRDKNGKPVPPLEEHLVQHLYPHAPGAGAQRIRSVTGSNALSYGGGLHSNGSADLAAVERIVTLEADKTRLLQEKEEQLERDHKNHRRIVELELALEAAKRSAEDARREVERVRAEAGRSSQDKLLTVMLPLLIQKRDDFGPVLQAMTAQSSQSQEVMTTILSSLLSQAGQRQDTVGQLDQLMGLVQKIRGETEDGDGGALEVVGKIADAASGFLSNLKPPVPGSAPPPAPAPVAGPAPLTEAVEVPPGSLATETFARLVADGIRDQPDPTNWARVAHGELSAEGRALLGQAESRLQVLGLLGKVPGLNVQAIGEHLNADEGASRWLSSAIGNLRELCQHVR